MKYLWYVFLILPLCIAAQARDVDFEMLQDTVTDTEADYNSDKAYKEFDLKGITQLKCSIKLIEENTALLSQYREGQWQVVDTLQYVTGLGEAFEITDFNKDGNEDFMLRAMVNMHSNAGYSIYLNSPNQNKLVILEETTDDGWSNPDYDPKKR